MSVSRVLYNYGDEYKSTSSGGSRSKNENSDDDTEDNSYFLMLNEKGDYGCFEFKDYGSYIKTWREYKSVGWINETSPIPKRV